MEQNTAAESQRDLQEIVVPIEGNFLEILDIPKDEFQDCIENDRELKELYKDVLDFWEENEDFNPQHTPPPQVMSEYTARYIQSLAFQLEKQLNPDSIERPWNPDDFELLYNFSLLLRVNVPDTIKPIADNTWDMLHQLKDRILSKDPSKKLFIRSFFTGSAIAEKELIRQMNEIGHDRWCIVTTDSKAMSNAYSAINLAHLNSLLPEEQKFKVLITDRKIDDEVERLINSNERIVIIQKGQAEEQCHYSGNIQWDALLLDNGLPYVPLEVGEEIVEETIKHKNPEAGLAVNILGLDSDIFVDIPDKEKYKEIFSLRNLFSDYRKKFTDYSPANYPHRYEYEEKDGVYNISKVYSYGAAMLFTLIRRNLTKAGTIKNLINHATGLSRAKSDVITSPFETHLSLLTLFKKNGIEYDETMRALDHKAFGFERKYTDGEWIFRDPRLDKELSKDEFYKLAKDLDPLVLRTSRFWVS